MKLTKTQLEQYHDQGFVVIPDVFPREELADINQEIDSLQETKKYRNPGWVMELGLHSDTTKNFAKDERLLSLIEDIVKPGIAIYSAKLTAKLPQSATECEWHQDDYYYVKNSESRTRMSVWVPLQDANEDNGCLWVVPESHKWGLHDHWKNENSQCPQVLHHEQHDYSGAIPVNMSAGSVVLFSALLWHSSRGNVTEQIRRAFIVSYQEATVEGGAKNQWKVLRPADV